MKKERGITLIALIITIIILVILAAVSIRAAYNSGIIDYSINGTKKYKEEEKKEESTIKGYESLFENIESKLKTDEGEKYHQDKEYIVLFNKHGNDYPTDLLLGKEEISNDFFASNNGKINLINFEDSNLNYTIDPLITFSIDNSYEIKDNIVLTETTPLIYNGYAYILKDTCELFKIEGRDGWTKFEEGNAQKVEDNFTVRENHYQGLDYLCLTYSNDIYNFEIGSYIENAKNIKSWCGMYYLTKDNYIYDSLSGNKIGNESYNLKEWYLGYFRNCIYFLTNDDKIGYIDSEANIYIINESIGIDEWFDNRQFVYNNNLYYIDGADIQLVMEDANIKEWYNEDYFITTNNDLYRSLIYNTLEGHDENAIELIAEDVDIKEWFDPWYYITQDNDLYYAYNDCLIAENVNIKEFYTRTGDPYYGCYLTQNNELYLFEVHGEAITTLLQENVSIRKWIPCYDMAYVTNDDKVYLITTYPTRSATLAAENIGFIDSYDEYFSAENGNLYYTQGGLYTMNSNISIKEWYCDERYITEDNCMYRYDTVIAEDCVVYNVKTDSYYNSNEEIYIYLTARGTR